jgi:putative transposase
MGVVIQTTETITCKHCGSTAIVKYGSYKGVPRYFCKSCKRKFKADDKQFKMKTSTEQVATALHDYYDGGSSVRAIGRHILQETGSTPSTATIYEWIQKYTQYIKDSIKDYHPKVGDTWIADETVLKIGGQQLWLWDIIDERTRYLLASRLSTSRTTRDAQILMDRAVRTADKHPKVVLTDKLASYLDVNYGKDTEHRQGSPFKVLSSGESTSQIERFHGTIKARTKVMRGLKNIETAHDFVDGFLAYYNYLRPHDSLDNKTPAEVAGIAYPYKNWADIISKHKPSVKVRVLHVERGTLKLPKTQIGRPRIRLTPQTSRISQPTPRISNAIYQRGGLVSRHSMGKGTRLVTKGKRGRGMMI